jgi:predicted PurR-regulated permease PerM
LIAWRQPTVTTEATGTAQTTATDTIATGNIATDTAPTRRVGLASLAGVVLIGVGAVAVTVFVPRVQHAISLTLAAACLAVLTLPVQQRAQRYLGSVASMVATGIASLAVTMTLGYLALRDLRSSAESVAELIRARLDGLQQGSLPQRVATALELDQAIDNWLSRIPSLVVVGEEGGTRVGTLVVELLAVVILSIFFQSSGRSIVDWVVSRWPRPVPVAADADVSADPTSPRVAARSLLAEVDRRGVGYVRRSIVLAACATTVVAAAALLFDTPGAVVVGIWAGAWFVVPALGWAIGLIPVALLVALDPGPSTWATLGVSAAVAAATVLARRRLVEPGTLRFGVAPHVLCIGVGMGIGSVAGSLIVLVIGAAACAALISQHRPGPPSGWFVEDVHAQRIAGITIPSGWRAGLLVMGLTAAGVLLWQLLDDSGPAIIWLVVGTFVAIAISRPVAKLERHTRLNHHASAAVVLAVFAVILVIVTVSGLDDGARATTTLTERLPDVVRDLEDTRFIGSFLRDRNASVWIDDQMTDLPERLDTVRPEEWLPTIGARLIDLFWIIVFATALLIDGPRLLRGAEQRVPARHRRQYARITGAIGTALAGYAAGSALVAGINATVVFSIAVALGVGMAPILATWAFLWNFVPQIGGFMGGLPLVLFAIVAGPLRGLFAALFYIVYQFIENHVIQPAVIGAAIDVAPWGTLVAALVGAAAAGVIGAVVLTPLVGVIRVVRRQLASDDFPGTTVTEGARHLP